LEAPLNQHVDLALGNTIVPAATVPCNRPRLHLNIVVTPFFINIINTDKEMKRGIKIKRNNIKREGNEKQEKKFNERF
jgi:hypothetical protein